MRALDHLAWESLRSLNSNEIRSVHSLDNGVCLTHALERVDDGQSGRGTSALPRLGDHVIDHFQRDEGSSRIVHYDDRDVVRKILESIANRIAALASSVYDRPISNESVFLGEVGLGGEIRPVSQSERRLAEAAKMGIHTAFMSKRSIPSRIAKGIRPVGVRTVAELFSHLFQ